MQSTKQYPEFVAYHFLDASGRLMAMEEDGKNTEKFLKEGFDVDGSSINGMASVEKSDLRLIPEKNTFQTIQIDDFVHHRFLAHFLDDKGEPHPRDPRGILKKIVDKAHGMGFEPYMFSEVEFYIVDSKTGEPADEAGYCSLPPEDKCYTFRQELGTLCKKLGMEVKRIHHENGPGQNEIELNLTPCLKNADDTILSMWLMQLLAAKRNQKIIFSPKPFPDKAGNGLHHHILLRDLVTGDNVFANTEFAVGTSGLDATITPMDRNNTSARLSKLCLQGIAGLIRHADEITAVFAASNESFQRLKPGFEAPIFKAWDFSNRTALVRVPHAAAVQQTRFEYRGGDLSGSVHLFGAVLLAAVLKGIEDELEAPPNADFNIETATHDIRPVPLTLEECIHVLKSSSFLQETLGPDMVQFLIERDEEIMAAVQMQD